MKQEFNYYLLTCRVYNVHICDTHNSGVMDSGVRCVTKMTDRSVTIHSVNMDDKQKYVKSARGMTDKNVLKVQGG